MTTKTTYQQKLLDPRWQKFRLKILERDGFKCVHCGDDKQTLHAHHTYYEQGGVDPWEYEDTFIITLCSTCHNDLHTKQKELLDKLIECIKRCGFNPLSLAHLICAFDILSWKKNKNELTNLSLNLAHIIGSDNALDNKFTKYFTTQKFDQAFDVREGFIQSEIVELLSR